MAAYADNLQKPPLLRDFFDVEAKPVGSGAFALVFKGREKGKSDENQTNCYAIKKFIAGINAKGEKLPNEVLMNLEMHQAKEFKDLRLDSTFVMKIFRLDLVEDHVSNRPCIVMEWLGGGELFDLVAEKSVSPNSMLKLGLEDRMKRMVKSVCRGLAYLHEKRIIHRDIKLDNTVFRFRPGLPDADDNLVLIDFGFWTEGEVCGKDMGRIEKRVLPKDVVGTPGYFAPELGVGNGTEAYSKDALGNYYISYYDTSDLFCVGIMLYVMCMGTYPDIKAASDIKRHLDSIQTPPWERNADLKSALYGLLDTDPRKRYTALDMLEHPWVDKEAARRAAALKLEAEARKTAAERAAAEKAAADKAAADKAAADKAAAGKEAKRLTAMSLMIKYSSEAANLRKNEMVENDDDAEDEGEEEEEEEESAGIFSSLSRGLRASLTLLMPAAAGMMQSMDRLDLLPDASALVKGFVTTAQLLDLEQILRGKLANADFFGTTTGASSRAQAQQQPLQRRDAQIVNLFDFDGGLSFEEFCDAMKEVNLHILASRELFDSFDENNNGRIDLQEFIASLSRFQNTAGSTLEDRTRMYFKLFDRNGDGKISEDELKAVVRMIEDNETAAARKASRASSAARDNRPGAAASFVPFKTGGEAAGGASAGASADDSHRATDYSSLFAKIDKDGSGEIDYQEFQQWFKDNESDMLFSNFRSQLEQAVDEPQPDSASPKLGSKGEA